MTPLPVLDGEDAGEPEGRGGGRGESGEGRSEEGGGRREEGGGRREEGGWQKKVVTETMEAYTQAPNQ